jgi:uncharacterized phage protein (TIGR01671 family)
MNRRIKFRVWDKVDNLMIDFETLLPAPRTFAKVLAGERKSVCELMQFTGLHDVNGVEIYEGDIILSWGYHLEVLWEESDASFLAASADGRIQESGQEWDNDCKVIGNIYQNPELLKD